MTETSPTVPLTCPSWCRSHDRDDVSRLGGGVTALHESEVLSWSDDGHQIAGIRRIDEYADGRLEGIYIENHQDSVWDVTAEQARRLAHALLKLADALEPEAAEARLPDST